MFFGRKKQEPEAEFKSAAQPVPAAEQPAPAEPEPVKKEVIHTEQRVRNTMEFNLIIGKNASLSGNMNVKGNMRVDGNIVGVIVVDDTLFIGDSGEANGNIYAQNIVVSGLIKGDVCCMGKMEMRPNCKVCANVRAKELVINEGAFFRGRSLGFEDMTEDASAQPAVEAAPEA